MAEWLLSLEHVKEADRVAAEEVGALVSVIERLDAALADGRVENRKGEARSLLDHRRRYSAELGRWLDRFGLSPSGRADVAQKVATGSLAFEIAERRREARQA